MIAIDDAGLPLFDPCLDRPGGFAWWYVDLRTDDDTTVVLIPSFGLPFLPGHGAAARGDRAPPARAVPSLAVSVVRRGRPAFYLLQRYAPEDASCADDAIRLGASWFHSARDGDRHRFHARLDCPLPGTTARLRGEVRLDGPAITLGPRDPAAPHRWTPLTTGTAEIDLALGGGLSIRGAGRAYHDRNGSDAPLHALGIRHWLWGRAAFPDGDLVTYALWPDGPGDPLVLAWWIDPDGAARPAGDVVVRSGPRIGWFGVPWWRRLDLRGGGGPTFELTHDRVVDDGPFYLRFHLTARRSDGSVGHGVAEAVRPGRVDAPWLRPLVRMAVHDTAGPNSPFLPLFAGEAEGRWSRLLPAPARLGVSR